MCTGQDVALTPSLEIEMLSPFLEILISPLVTPSATKEIYDLSEAEVPGVFLCGGVRYGIKPILVCSS